MHSFKSFRTIATLLALIAPITVQASEADLKIPPLDVVKFDSLGGVTGISLMWLGLLLCGIGAIATPWRNATRSSLALM